jgi:mRNA interferase RelE/StbE
MAWRIEFDPAAANELDELGPEPARRILRFLADRIAPHDDPRSLGEALKGAKWGDFWTYRVGDYRIIADFQDGLLTVLVVRIGNRREVYGR